MSGGLAGGSETVPSGDIKQAAARLHSRYNPQAEAERYIDALDLRSGIEYFILIEPGYGYVIPVLKNRYPDSTIIVLHADSRFRDARPPLPLMEKIPVWYPDSGISVQDFLEGEIPGALAASLRIIEWRPSLSVYGNACLQLVSDTVEFLRRADASNRTAAMFGRRWIKNFFRNTSLVRQALRFRPMAKPVIITGSGPGLENALPEIGAMRKEVFILAASSSLLALVERGIAPDMIISTDGGSWALLHLRSCFRFPAKTAAVHGTGRLALSLFAALPSQCADVPFLILNEGSLWQNIVLNALGIPSVIFPQRGTVTASALDLALALTGGDIYLAGMDLAVRDIRTHARPYGFDYLFSGTASRLRPVYSQCFTRSAGMRQGGSHTVYAEWFKKQLAACPRRIFSLGGNHAVFEEHFQAVRAGKCDNDCVNNYFTTETIHGRPVERIRRGTGALFAALGDSRYSRIISAELSPLLFPGEKNIQADTIQERLGEILPRGTGAGSG